MKLATIGHTRRLCQKTAILSSVSSSIIEPLGKPPPKTSSNKIDPVEYFSGLSGISWKRFGFFYGFIFKRGENFESAVKREDRFILLKFGSP
jgi:hypothetical protein